MIHNEQHHSTTNTDGYDTLVEAPTCPTPEFLQVLPSEWRHHVGVECTVQQSQLLEGEHSHARQPQYSGRVLPQQVAVSEKEVVCSVHCVQPMIT